MVIRAAGAVRLRQSRMTAALHNESFLRACLREPTNHTPVWLMRQAGRYLPEYRASRAKAGSFMGLATNADFATEVTMQPLARYPLDAAILFSDILTVPDAMGLGLSFALGEGPRFSNPLPSTIATFAPSAAARRDAATPPDPAPRVMRSKSNVMSRSPAAGLAPANRWRALRVDASRDGGAVGQCRTCRPIPPRPALAVGLSG